MEVPSPLKDFLYKLPNHPYILRLVWSWVHLGLGILVGAALSLQVSYMYFPSKIYLSMDPATKSGSPARRQLYVGVLTAGVFLDTRALAVHRTWARDVDNLEFFTGSVTGSTTTDMPLVVLQGLNDYQYPPQKKSFRMLSYMCDHYVDKFHWFVRADDDSYIKVDRLQELLNKLDKGKMIYLGQEGVGRPQDITRLQLDGSNFCMGGPGVVFSRPLLKALCPYLPLCETEVVSEEEDVEIGRCITRYLGIQCTRSKELQKLFFHAYLGTYSGEEPFTSDLSQDTRFTQAITLHFAKKPEAMYNLRYYHLAEMNQGKLQKIRLYETQIKNLTKVPIS